MVYRSVSAFSNNSTRTSTRTVNCTRQSKSGFRQLRVLVPTFRFEGTTSTVVRLVDYLFTRIYMYVQYKRV